MKIFVENLSKGSVKYAEAQRVLKAVNMQIRRDFSPAWDTTARLFYRKAGQYDPENACDAVLYLLHSSDVDNALGAHAANHTGVPYGFIALDLCEQLEEPWSSTLSHEALELIEDPEANILAAGPSPRNASKTVFHWYEMCDAVQSELYDIDGVKVSNFVLPLYFTPVGAGKKTNFLGTKLSPFGIRPGGYVGYFDPATGQDTTYFPKSDKEAAARFKTKAKFGIGRTSKRGTR